MKCLCCDNELLDGEDAICLECLLTFPYADCANPQNLLWKELCGHFPFEHATTLAYYQRGTNFASMITRAKYHGMPDINALLTNLLLDQLKQSDWPYDIDLIIPMPLHWLRLLQRGYNQVSPIVNTLSAQWHIPVMRDCLVRRKYLSSQVGKGFDDRQQQQQSNAFGLNHAERLTDKHVLLVDDVMTTGASLTACADLLLQVPGLRLSILTLALTRG